MEDIIFILIVLGIILIVIQVYWEIHMRTDDKYISKKSSEEIEEEFDKKREEGNLNWFYTFCLSVRKFVCKRILLKVGAILLGIGLILNMTF